MSGDSGATAFMEQSGGALARVLSDVAPESLDDHELLEFVAACERQVAWATALQLEALAQFARRPARIERVGDDPAAARANDAPLGDRVREFADDEVSARLRISRQTAANRIGLACALVGLPATAGSLRGGRIDVARARVMADETAALDAETAREIDGAFVTDAEQLSPARLRPKIRRAVVAADSVAAAERSSRARDERRVVITPTVDGMAELWAMLPAPDAIAIETALGAVARAGKAAALPDDRRTMDQRRADALAAPFVEALATGELAGARLARRRGRVAELQVTVAASTLLGHDDQPAELHGYGPITADVARELAVDARWRRILTDPLDDTVLDVGTTVYRPPADLDRHVKVRYRRCAFPGCGWLAVACDLDHTVPFPEGPTAAHNLAPLCRRHHRLKQAPGVTVRRLPDGTFSWTLPTGHRHRSGP